MPYVYVSYINQVYILVIYRSFSVRDWKNSFWIWTLHWRRKRELNEGINPHTHLINGLTSLSSSSLLWIIMDDEYAHVSLILRFFLFSLRRERLVYVGISVENIIPNPVSMQPILYYIYI